MSPSIQILEKIIGDFGGLATDERKCNCKSGISHEVCGFCFSVKFVWKKFLIILLKELFH